MTATFTTTVINLITAAQQGTLTDVVTAVDWVVTAKDGTKLARVSGLTPVGPADAAKFTAFPKLTLEEVLAWIPDPATDAIKTKLTDMLAAMVPPAPRTVSKRPPPWAVPSRPFIGNR